MAEGKPTQSERLTKIESTIASLADRMDRMDAMTDSVHKLASAMEVMANDQSYTKKEVEKIGRQVECLMGASGKKWDTVSLGIITTIIAAIIGLLVGKFI